MGNLKIGRMILGSCQTNCYFVYRDSNDTEKEAIFIDPADRGDYIYEALKNNGLRVAGILLTHGHFDHILGADRLRELSGAPIYAWEAEREVCESAVLNISRDTGQECVISADEYLKDGAELTIAGMTCRLIATPGHTKGSCCYYFAEDKLLISGDTLFQESVGRTDFPTGSMGTLVRSIKEKLFVLPEDVKVCPGHGEITEIGYEKRNNPFCQ